MSAADDAKITEDAVEFLNNTFWCYSCCCVGSGCSGPMNPMIFGQNKCLCFQSTTSSEEEVCGPMGCIQEFNKFLCLVSHTQFPPEGIACALCNMFCVGEPPKQPQDADSLDLSFMSDSFWLFYGCCRGVGFTSKITEPMVSGQAKLCCMFSKQFTTDFVGPRGCINENNKCCCFNSYFALPPTITPGVGLCNMMFVGDSRRDFARSAPGQQEMS